MIDDKWLSVEDISEYLGVKKNTVYKWLQNGGIPSHKIGRLWKFKKKEVDDWITTGAAKRVNTSKG